ncbi:MAG: transcription elongation factor GreA [Patescibacteria group bacterium]
MAPGVKTYLSKQKHKELTSELTNLKTARRKEVAEKLEYAKSLGDLSENAEYHEAREDQANVEKRILEIETTLKNAEVVEKHHSNAVEVGSVVIVQKDGDKEKRNYQIVGSTEANSASGKISHVSPLGEALMGKKKGDTAIFQSPKGKVQYKVVDIE